MKRRLVAPLTVLLLLALVSPDLAVAGGRLTMRHSVSCSSKGNYVITWRVKEYFPGAVAHLTWSSPEGRWHGEWDWVHHPISYTSTLWMRERAPGTTQGDLKLAVRVVWKDAETGRIRDRGTFRDSLRLAGDCGTEPSPSPSPTSSPSPSPAHTVTYQVTGATATVDVTYNNQNDDAEQANGVPVPWTYSFGASAGLFLYVSAQKDGSENGNVTCTIYVDGTVRESNTSTGPYAICTSSDTL